MASSDSDSYSEQVINLHNEMVIKISGMIYKGCECWDSLLGMFSNNPLTPREKESIKSILDLFEILMQREEISYGKYEKLRKKMSVIHKLAATKIKNYEDRIKTLFEQDEAESTKIEKRSRSENKEETGRGNRSKREYSDSSRTVTEDDKQKLHADMVQKLSEELSSLTVGKWAEFKNKMRYYMKFGEAVLAEITDMFSACKIMMAKGKIHIGEYDKLIEVVEDVDQKLVEIINEHLKKMGIEPTLTMKRMRTRSSDSS